MQMTRSLDRRLLVKICIYVVRVQLCQSSRMCSIFADSMSNSMQRERAYNYASASDNENPRDDVRSRTRNSKRQRRSNRNRAGRSDVGIEQTHEPSANNYPPW